MPQQELFNEKGVTLVRDGPLLTMSLDRGENRVNLEMAQLLTAALTVAEQVEGSKALVIISRNEKFFCNGLDLDWMNTADKEAEGKMFHTFWTFLSRLLTMNCHTVAAIGGHGFGAGFFIALACDFRVMRTEKGFLNFPEANLGMRLSKPFAELAKAKCSTATLRQGVLLGTRYNSSTGIAAGVVDVECSVENLEQEAGKLARSMLPDTLKLMRFSSENFRNMKMELYTDAYRALRGGKDGPPDSRL